MYMLYNVLACPLQSNFVFAQTSASLVLSPPPLNDPTNRRAEFIIEDKVPRNHGAL